MVKPKAMVFGKGLDMTIHKNESGYAFFNGKPRKMGKRVKLEVVVMLDPVPGTCHEIDDHVYLIMRDNPYVETVEVKEDI